MAFPTIFLPPFGLQGVLLQVSLIGDGAVRGGPWKDKVIS